MSVEGTVHPRFEPVRDAFSEIIASQGGTGSAVAAWHDGAWVADLWGGSADAFHSRRWERDSIVQVYSVSKPFVAVCALLLVDRGRLDLDAAMQRYWPEFTAEATVRQVLSHEAGVVALDGAAPTEAFYEWDHLCALLARQPPSWPPGTAHGESALFYGHLVGELVRRVSGRSPGRFLRDEIAGPLGLEFSIGLTAEEQARTVDLTGLTEQFHRGNAAGRPALYSRAIGNPPGAQDPDVVNGSRWRAAEVPAINGHGTARGIAGFYVALLHRGLLSGPLLQEATGAHCSGPDLVMGGNNAWGLGFGVDPSGFGMGGLGGSVGWACPDHRYAFGFVTGSAGTDERATILENVVRSCAGLPPLD